MQPKIEENPITFSMNSEKDKRKYGLKTQGRATCL